jgi:hypothetical protein
MQNLRLQKKDGKKTPSKTGEFWMNEKITTGKGRTFGAQSLR